MVKLVDFKVFYIVFNNNWVIVVKFGFVVIIEFFDIFGLVFDKYVCLVVIKNINIFFEIFIKMFDFRRVVVIGEIKIEFSVE